LRKHPTKIIAGLIRVQNGKIYFLLAIGPILAYQQQLKAQLFQAKKLPKYSINNIGW
jgi:hypothetical protein